MTLNDRERAPATLRPQAAPLPPPPLSPIRRFFLPIFFVAVAAEMAAVKSREGTRFPFWIAFSPLQCEETFLRKLRRPETVISFFFLFFALRSPSFIAWGPTFLNLMAKSQAWAGYSPAIYMQMLTTGAERKEVKKHGTTIRKMNWGKNRLRNPWKRVLSPKLTSVRMSTRRNPAAIPAAHRRDCRGSLESTRIAASRRRASSILGRARFPGLIPTILARRKEAPGCLAKNCCCPR